MNDRTPPHNLEAEQAVIGSMLLSPESVDVALGSLTADDFYRPAHSRIFTAIRTLHASGHAIDSLSVADALGSELEASGGKMYLLDLSSSVPTTANSGRYAEIVKRTSRQRLAIAAGIHITAMGYNGDDPDEIIADAHRSIAGIESASSKSRSASEMMSGLDLTESIQSLHTDLLPHTPLLRGFLLTIGAREAVGKSAFLAQMCHELATRHVRVRIVSLEMSADDYMRRLIQHLTGISIPDQIRGLDAQKAEQVAQFMDGDWMRFLEVDDSNPTIDELKRDTRRFAKSGGWLVGIDNLAILVKQSYEDITECTRELKCMANDSSLKGASDRRPIVALVSHLNRNQFREDGTLRRPSLGDLRGSGSIGQDSDVVALLHRYDANLDQKVRERLRNAGYLLEWDRQSGGNEPYRHLSEVQVAKNRYGPTDAYPAWFSGPDVEWSFVNRTSDGRRV